MKNKVSKKGAASAASKPRPKVWVGRIPMGKDWGWLKLVTTKRWRLVRYRREETDRKCPWRVEIVTETKAEYKRLLGLDFATQMATVLVCSKRDARKLLKLIGEVLVGQKKEVEG